MSERPFYKDGGTTNGAAWYSLAGGKEINNPGICGDSF
jgi:hypothetical protein